MVEPFIVKSCHVMHEQEGFFFEVSVGTGCKSIGIELYQGIFKVKMIWWHIGLVWGD